MTTVRNIRFRVYAGENGRTGLYVEARVFATKAEMLTALRIEAEVMGTPGFSNRVGGVMQSYKRTSYASGRARTSPCIGRVNLYKRGMDTETIVHEFGHAMFAWGARKKLLGKLNDRNTDMPVEEQLCYTLGRMVYRFIYDAHRLGLSQ